MLYNVTVDGCDDSTTVEADLTPEQFAFLSALAQRITDASTYRCMPTMQVEEAK